MSLRPGDPDTPAFPDFFLPTPSGAFQTPALPGGVSDLWPEPSLWETVLSCFYNKNCHSLKADPVPSDGVEIFSIYSLI